MLFPSNKNGRTDGQKRPLTKTKMKQEIRKKQKILHHLYKRSLALPARTNTELDTPRQQKQQRETDGTLERLDINVPMPILYPPHRAPHHQSAIDLAAPLGANKAYQGSPIHLLTTDAIMAQKYFAKVIEVKTTLDMLELEGPNGPDVPFGGGRGRRDASPLAELLGFRPLVNMIFADEVPGISVLSFADGL